MTAAEIKAKQEHDKAKFAKMAAATGDPEAKHMGPAKAGGQWFKNYKTGVLYRVDEYNGAFKLAESRGGCDVAKQSKPKAEPKPKVDKGPKRADLMREARECKIKYFRILNKAELTEVLAKSTSEQRIKEIQDAAVKRWKSGWRFDKKETE